MILMVLSHVWWKFLYRREQIKDESQKVVFVQFVQSDMIEKWGVNRVSQFPIKGQNCPPGNPGWDWRKDYRKSQFIGYTDNNSQRRSTVKSRTALKVSQYLLTTKYPGSTECYYAHTAVRSMLNSNSYSSCVRLVIIHSAKRCKITWGHGFNTCSKTVQGGAGWHSYERLNTNDKCCCYIS